MAKMNHDWECRASLRTTRTSEVRHRGRLPPIIALSARWAGKLTFFLLQGRPEASACFLMAGTLLPPGDRLYITVATSLKLCNSDVNECTARGSRLPKRFLEEVLQWLGLASLQASETREWSRLTPMGTQVVINAAFAYNFHILMLSLKPDRERSHVYVLFSVHGDRRGLQARASSQHGGRVQRRQ